MILIFFIFSFCFAAQKFKRNCTLTQNHLSCNIKKKEPILLHDRIKTISNTREKYTSHQLLDIEPIDKIIKIKNNTETTKNNSPCTCKKEKITSDNEKIRNLIDEAKKQTTNNVKDPSEIYKNHLFYTFRDPNSSIEIKNAETDVNKIYITKTEINFSSKDRKNIICYLNVDQSSKVGKFFKWKNNVVIKSNVIIGNNVNIGSDVLIEDFCVIEDNVTIGEGCILSKHTMICENSTIGKNNFFGENVKIGFCYGSYIEDIQIIKLKIAQKSFNEDSKNLMNSINFIEIGSDNIFSEGVSIGYVDEIGDKNFFMTDMIVCDKVFIGNNNKFGLIIPDPIIVSPIDYENIKNPKCNNLFNFFSQIGSKKHISIKERLNLEKPYEPKILDKMINNDCKFIIKENVRIGDFNRFKQNTFISDYVRIRNFNKFEENIIIGEKVYIENNNYFSAYFSINCCSEIQSNNHIKKCVFIGSEVKIANNSRFYEGSMICDYAELENGAVVNRNTIFQNKLAKEIGIVAPKKRKNYLCIKKQKSK